MFEFSGSSASDGPGVYLQAALHGGERPGTAALHNLIRLLKEAEAKDRISGRVVIVPEANPIGAAQQHLGAQQGRFDLGTRVNFNRDFPLLDRVDHDTMNELAERGHDLNNSPGDRLKARLLSMALECDIVLDLHCDDESLPYLYVPTPLWPASADLASALGVSAVILGSDYQDAAFESAVIAPFAEGLVRTPLSGRVVATVELRGLLDVSSDIAQRDATGLYRFMARRGVIDDPTIMPTGSWSGTAVDIGNVEVVTTPVSGTILFHARPGAVLSVGQPVATIITSPGDHDLDHIVTAPQSGLVLTRSSQRFAQSGAPLIKLLGGSKSRTARTGTLEA